jgi:hypothetical protein
MAIFQMPIDKKIIDIKSAITKAFVSGIMPVVHPTDDEIKEALDILGLNGDDLRCVYCGDKSTEWDHLRPLIINRKPTGYISEIANLVPACGKCNQSKGKKEWRTWMESTAKLSPKTRGVANLKERIDRLEAYENWRDVKPINFEELVSADIWEEYWRHLQIIEDALNVATQEAGKVKKKISECLQEQHKSEDES